MLRKRNQPVECKCQKQGYALTKTRMRETKYGGRIEKKSGCD